MNEVLEQLEKALKKYRPDLLIQFYVYIDFLARLESNV